MSSFSTNWLTARQSGVLAHISSLPSKTGIGNLGTNARRFVDFLADAGFAYWQVCPVGPTGYGDSPYQSFSAFAGNPYFIDLEELVEHGLLTDGEIAGLRELSNDRVDYGELYQQFWIVIEIAFKRFDPKKFRLPDGPSFEDFRHENAYWIDAYTNFMALKSRFDNKSWITWPIEFRDPLLDVEELLSLSDFLERSRHAFYQYVFFSQWHRLKSYANAKGVQIIGDIPIYVALDSADAWNRRDTFRIDLDGKQDAVAGVPPDYFSETGQLWGNPLYNWDLLAQNGYEWWIERIRASLDLFDVLRFDHFRGFANYWVVPADAVDASEGVWEDGPGMAIFQAIEQSIPNAKFIAEDLGYIDNEVFKLREDSGYPGMKIMQFGYGHDDNNVNLPHFFKQNQVVYTGTHDNDTTQGWINSLSGETRQQVFNYFDLHEDPSADKIIQSAFASVAQLVVTPVQDLLNLPSSARMNRPGTATGNWQWRFTNEAFNLLSREIAQKYKKLHERYHRTDDCRQRDYSAPPLKQIPERVPERAVV